jgi:hypothetical protein
MINLSFLYRINGPSSFFMFFFVGNQMCFQDTNVRYCYGTVISYLVVILGFCVEIFGPGASSLLFFFKK